MKIKESDIAKAVVNWLQDHNWEVYQEVGSGKDYSGNRADIVAVMGSLIWAIEVKTSFSFKVLEQANHWKRYANLVSVAVPKKKGQWRSYTSGKRNFEVKVCGLLDIGLIEIDHRQELKVNETTPPKLRRKISPNLKQNLREEHKIWAEAGNAQNQYFTPFKLTVNNLIQFVKAHPGTHLKEAMDNIEHHYKKNGTARACISKYIYDGIIDGIVMVPSGRYKKLYLKGQEPKRAVQLKLF